MIEMTCKLLQHRLLEKDIDLSDSRFKYKEFKVSMKHTIPLQLNIIVIITIVFIDIIISIVIIIIIIIIIIINIIFI